MHNVFVISDGTGRTAAQLLEAALTQFPDTEIDIRIRSAIRTHDQVLAVITEAR